MDTYKVNNPMPGSHKIDLSGQQFHYLTVIEKTGTVNKHQNLLWKCKCTCGNVIEATTTVLRKGKKKSCGCKRWARGSGVYNYNGFMDITGTKFCSIQLNAKTRKIPFAITKQDIWNQIEFQNHQCAMTCIPISFVNGTASVDRIDNAKGYTDDNIQIVHKDVTIMRNKFTISRFKEICRLVSKYN